jgi:hypothetical protein
MDVAMYFWYLLLGRLYVLNALRFCAPSYVPVQNAASGLCAERGAGTGS